MPRKQGGQGPAYDALHPEGDAEDPMQQLPSFLDTDEEAAMPLMATASAPAQATSGLRPQCSSDWPSGDDEADDPLRRQGTMSLSFGGGVPLQSASSMSRKGSNGLWRRKVEEVITLNRLLSARYQPGQEPGVDVRRHDYSSLYSHLHTRSTISCVDYSAANVVFAGQLDNDSLGAFLEKPRPPWSKVRWLNVQGLSWDVITTLAKHYDLHPLAVEDIVHPLADHVPQRIKADFYPESIFCSMILVSVQSPSCLETPSAAAPCSASGRCSPREGPSSGAAAPAGASDLAPTAIAHDGKGNHRATFRTRLLRPSHRRHGRQMGATLADGALYMPMELVVEQASLFLLKDGTVLSLFQTEGERVCKPIMERLLSRKTLLTESEDPSFLFNSIIDAIVDHAMPVVQIYASKIAALESRVLLETRPRAVYTKELHLLSNDLNVLRRALVPTQHLVNKLIAGGLTPTGPSNGTQAAVMCGSPAGAALVSQLTRLYLGDVMDHVSSIVEDMQTLSEQAKDLIDLIFNTNTHQQNISMQILTIIQAIFLPLSFLAGVYGTNFVEFPEIHWKYGYIYFWGVCAFVTVVFITLLRKWGLFAG